jgi:YD repeat-containing protein
MMDDVIAKEAANSPAGSQAKIHARLQNDQEYALFMALKYNALGSIPSDIGDYELRTIATGSFPVPNCDKGGSLMVQQNGYNLVCGDVAYRFYEDGMLRQGFTGNIGIFKLTYDENRKLIGASNGIKNLKFTWGASGIEKIAVRATYEAEKEEVLTHGPRGELTSLHYPNGLSYKFSYNANLDMTAIAYDDGTSETLTYDEDDRVTSRRRRNGDVTVFRYEDRSATCFNYVTTMHKSAGDPGGRAFVFRLAQGPQRGKPCQDTALELVPD